MSSLSRFKSAILTSLALLLVACFSACNSEPKLYPLTGKVTLGGKAYERLIVYFRPINKQVETYNLGVGETDRQGNLALRSSAGDGLAAGKYRVTFTCLRQESSDEPIGARGEKPEDSDRSVVAVELVPEAYREGIGASTVEFEIKKNKPNNFVFDIPLN